MKHKINITKIRFSYLKIWILSVLFLFYAWGFPTPIAFTQEASDVQSYKINGKEVKQYLMDKYELKKHDVTSSLKQTLNGANGSIHIRGNLTPKKTITPKKEKYGMARAVAEAFLEEESTPLFGITNLADISEFSVSGDGRIHILYYRYVGNLRLEGSSVVSAK